jgi:hypothetical protein
MSKRKTDREPVRVKIDSIEIRKDFQVRCVIEQDVVDEYATLLDEGGELDPIHIFESERPKKGEPEKPPYFTSDGFHRIEAYLKAQRDKIPAIIHDGEDWQALELAIDRNAHHGHPLTNADKRKAAKMALDNPILRRCSNTALARLCGTSPAFIDNMRKGKVRVEGAGPRKKAKRKPSTTVVTAGEPETTVSAADEKSANLRSWLKSGLIDWPMVLGVLHQIEKKLKFLAVPRKEIVVVFKVGEKTTREEVAEDVQVKGGKLEILLGAGEDLVPQEQVAANAK